LTDPAVHAHEKASSIYSKACLLGLRAPTEPTVANMTALHLVASEGLQGAVGMAAKLKHESFRLVKAQFKKVVQQSANDQPTLMLSLP